MAYKKHNFNNISCQPVFNLAQLNLNGFDQGILMLKKLCLSETVSIVFTQESWLNSDQLCYFDEVKTDFYVFGISAMDKTLGQGILKGRPKGGVSTFVHKSLKNAFGRVTCISCAEKFVIVTVGQLLLINVYLPSVKSAEDMDELRLIFSDIETFLADVECNYAVFGGDFNVNVMQDNAVSQFINDWMAELNLTLANYVLRIPCTITYTFKAKLRDAYSYTDHFYVSNNLANLAQSIIDVDSYENFSDHDPIVLTLDNGIYDLCKQNINVENKNRVTITDKFDSHVNVLFDWEKCYKSDYYNSTRIGMDSLCNLFLNSDLTALKRIRSDIFSQKGINDIYRNVVHALYNASLKTINSKNKISHNKHG